MDGEQNNDCANLSQVNAAEVLSSVATLLIRSIINPYNIYSYFLYNSHL